MAGNLGLLRYSHSPTPNQKGSSQISTSAFIIPIYHFPLDHQVAGTQNRFPSNWFISLRDKNRSCYVCQVSHTIKLNHVFIHQLLPKAYLNQYSNETAIICHLPSLILLPVSLAPGGLLLLRVPSGDVRQRNISSDNSCRR